MAERSTRTRRLHLTMSKAKDSFRLGALVNVRPIVDADTGVSLDISAVIDPRATRRSGW